MSKIPASMAKIMEVFRVNKKGWESIKGLKVSYEVLKSSYMGAVLSVLSVSIGGLCY